MSKKPKRAIPVHRLIDVTRGMEFAPHTPAGKTRLELENRGPFRPGKTLRDWAGVPLRAS